MCSMKKGVLIKKRVTNKTPVPESPEVCNFIKKETLAQVFSCEFCEISKNTFFFRTPLDDCFCILKEEIKRFLNTVKTNYKNQI